MKLRYRAREDCIETTIRLPPAKRTIDPRVVDLRASILVLLDRQFLPLTPHVEQLQNVTKECMQGQLRRWTALPTLRCGKTNCRNCSRLNSVGMPCHCALLAILVPQEKGP